jgi:hypothetical protein
MIKKTRAKFKKRLVDKELKNQEDEEHRKEELQQ